MEINKLSLSELLEHEEIVEKIIKYLNMLENIYRPKWFNDGIGFSVKLKDDDESK